MRNILEIYKEYKIMPNLAMHQMRVAAVAMEILESLDTQIDEESVVKACLLHDMGNIIKFKLDHFPNENEPEGMDHWKTVKDDYINKYGQDEHIASLLISRELGVSEYVYDLINSIDASHVEIISKDNDFGKKICLYADNRVTPHGVVSMDDRNIEAKERYKDHPHSFTEDERTIFMKNMIETEEQIFANSKIKPEDINDDSIVKYMEKLQNFEI